MNQGTRFAVCGAAAGSVTGSLGAVARAATTGGLVSVYGWRGALDFPILAATGALVGALVGLGVARLAKRRAQSGPPIPVRRFVGAALLAIGLLAVGFHFVLEHFDPTALPKRPARTGPRPPDVVIVIYDAVRADIVSDANGEVFDWEPRLKGFADRSVRFTQAVAPAPWTVPSHASLFSGLSPLDHGAIEESPRIGDEIETLAETLQDRGYRTLALVANPWLDHVRGFAQGFERYLELWRMKDQQSDLPLFFRALGRFERSGWFDVEDPREDKGARLMSVVAEDAIARLDPDEPLFLFVNLVDAHPPYWAPPSDRLRFVPPELIAKGIDPAAVPKHWAGIFAGKEVLSEDQRRVLRALNMGEVSYMDRYLGALFDALDRHGRLRDSFVVVTADHGAGLGEDRLVGSGFDLRESMLRIPMIVHFPAERFAGTKRDDLVFLHDLHPTILALANNGDTAADPDAADPGAASRGSRSLLSSTPRVAGLAAYSRPIYMLHYLKVAFPDFDASALDRTLTAIRGTRYKLVSSSAGHDSLFDLAGKGEQEDIGEREPELRAQQRTLLERIAGGSLDAVWRRCIEFALQRPHATDQIDPESVEYLRHLGYTVGGTK